MCGIERGACGQKCIPFRNYIPSVHGCVEVQRGQGIGNTSKRMATEKNSECCAEQLLHMDDAVHLVDYNDKKKYKQATKAAEESQESINEFSEEFKMMKMEVRAKQEKG